MRFPLPGFVRRSDPLGACAFVALLGVASPPAGQPARPAPLEVFTASDATIELLLLSPDPKDQAWGAYLAGRDARHGAVPMLQQLVSRHAHAESWEEQAVLDSALDALIQLDAALPQEIALAVYENRPHQALILLSRAEWDENTELVELLERETGAAWVAIANILIDRRAEGLAAALLARLEIVVELTVSESGVVGSWLCGGAAGEMGGGVACGAADVRADFPPRAQYALTRWAVPGAVVLMAGPVPVYYRRSAATSAGGSWTHDLVEELDTGDTLKYIAALLWTDEEALPIRARENYSMAPADLDSERARIRQDVADRYRQVLDMLVEAELLAADAASQLSPRIKVITYETPPKGCEK